MSIAIDCQKYVHPGEGCAMRAADVFRRVFIGNVKMYIIVHLLPVFIFKLKDLKKDPLRTLGKAIKNVIQSTCWLAGFVAMFRYGQCWGNYLFGDKYPRLAIAMGAAFCNIPHIIEARSRVKELALFCVPKALEASWNYLEKRNLAFHSKLLDYFVFSFAVAIVAVGSQGKENMLSKTY